MAHPEQAANAHFDPMMGIPALDHYAKAYAGQADRRHPHLSPLYGNPTGLPPMLITVGTAELFLFEIRDWKAKCDAAGTKCEVIEMDGATHDFAIMLTLMPEAREVLPAQVEFLHGQRLPSSG
jgi:acetyl esterase/lipase